MLSSADPINILRVGRSARRMTVFPRRGWQWADPHFYMTNSGTSEQPAREECDGCQYIVLKLLDQHRLHDRDLVARRCGMVARERALRAEGRKMKGRVVSGECVATSARPK